MFSPGSSITIPPMVSVFTKGIGWVAEDVSSAAPTSLSWESADRAVFYPISLPSPCVVKRVWWANGATTTGGANIDVGIYSDDGFAPGTRLVYGSAVQGTASEVQFVDVTDTSLPPGSYWIGVASDSNTNTTMFAAVVAGTTQMDALFRVQRSSGQPLPDPAGTVAEGANTCIYLCGFSTTASP